MNKKARINYIRALSSQVERKKMYKAKKQWVVAGISFLVATGLGAVGSHLTTHAAQVNNPTTNRVASGINNSQNSPASANNQQQSSASVKNIKPVSASNVQSQASGLHSKLLLQHDNKPTTPQHHALNLGTTYTQSKHLLGSNEPEQTQGTQKATDTNWIYSRNGFLSDGQVTNNWKTQSNYRGLNWEYNSDVKAAEFTSGSLTDGNGFMGSAPSDIKAAKSIKFDNGTIASNSLNSFLNNDTNLVSLNMNGLDTSHTSDMAHMLFGDKSLVAVKASDIDVSNVTNMASVFQSTNLSDLDLSDWDTYNVKNFASFIDGDKNLKVLNLSGEFNNRRALRSYISNSYPDGFAYALPAANIKKIILGPNAILSRYTTWNPKFSGAFDPTHFLNYNYISSDGKYQKINDGQAHQGVWTKDAEVINVNYDGKTVGSGVDFKPLGTNDTVSDVFINLPSKYSINNSDKSKSFSVSDGVTSINAHLAASDTITSASSVIKSDSEKVADLSNADSNDTSFASSQVSDISHDLSNISGYISAINNSNTSAEVSNANSAYDNAYSANTDIESMMANSVSSESSAIASLDSMQVVAFYVTPSDKLTNHSGVGLSAPSPSYLGTYKHFKQNKLDAPTGYHFNDAQRMGVHRVNMQLGSTKKPVLLLADEDPDGQVQSDSVTVYGNPVEYSGAATLHFSDDNSSAISASGLSNGNITVPYDIRTYVGDKINLIDAILHQNGDLDSNGNSRNDSDLPSSLVNQTVSNASNNSFDLANVSYVGSNPTTDYQITIDSNANGNNASSAAVSSGVNPTFTFKANKDSSENIIYKYGSSNVSSASVASTGDYYDTSTVNSYPAGWHLSSGANNQFTYGSNNNSEVVQVVPNTITDTIYYKVSDNSKFAKHGQTLSSEVITLDDNRTATSGSNSLNYSIPTTNNSYVSSGYSITSGASNSLTYQTNSANSSVSNTVWLTPSAAQFTVHFSNEDNSNSSVGSYTYSGYVDNPVNVSNATASKGASQTSNDPLPYNYTIDGTNTSFTYNANSTSNNANIEVTPKGTPETIDYIYYGSNGKSFGEGSTSLANGSYGTSSTLSSNYNVGLSSGWKISSGANTSFTYNDSTEDIPVSPIQETDTVNYIYNGFTSNTASGQISVASYSAGSALYSGNDYRATNAGSNTFTISGSANNLDSRYHIDNGNGSEANGLTFNYDGNSHNVYVTPENADIKINYYDQNGSEFGNSQTITAQDLTNHGFSNLVGKQIDLNNPTKNGAILTVPTGYHLKSDVTEKVPLTLDVPFYETKNIGGIHKAVSEVLNLRAIPTNATNNDNTQINSESSAVNSEMSSVNSMMSNSNINGETWQSLSSAKSVINSASIVIASASGKGNTDLSSANAASSTANDEFNTASSIDNSFISSSTAASNSAKANTASETNNAVQSAINSVNANNQIANDSASVSNDSNITNSMMNNSNISGSTKDSIISASSAIASASSAIHNDMNGGTSAESNASNALASASNAYSGVTSFLSSVANSISSASASAKASEAKNSASASVKSSATSASASAALSNSTSQINANISSAKNWTSNSAMNSANRSSINNDISMMNADISEADQYINQGVSGSASAAPYLASASSAYSAASSLANSATNSYNNSVSASTLSSLVTNAVSNATKSNKPASASSVSLTSNEEQAIANDIDVNIKPNSAVVTNTVVDHSALTSLTNEVATENQSINSLANKPAPTATVNYNNFDNLINQGIDRLENTINTDFKATIHHTATAKTTNEPITRGFKQVKKHIRWIMITKPIKLYNKHGVARTLRPSKVTLDVHSVYKVHGHFVFKVSYHHHTYFMTDNHKTFKNAYLPKSDNLIGKKVRVLHNVYAYRHKASDKVRTLHRGFTGRIKNIVRLGNYNMTRIQLTNGNWISANKNFVKAL